MRIENSPVEFDMVSPGKAESNKNGVNPEQLFAAGYSACSESALRLTARRRNIELKSTSIEAEIGLGEMDNGNYSLFANITALISGVDQATADMLVQGAHQICPYSNATRGNIEVNVSARAVSETSGKAS